MQLVLGHARLTTTQIYLTPRKEDVIGDVHDTLLRKVNLYIAPPGLGVRWIVHVDPFHLSASAAAKSEFPTAVHAVAEMHDMP